MLNIYSHSIYYSNIFYFLILAYLRYLRYTVVVFIYILCLACFLFTMFCFNIFCSHGQNTATIGWMIKRTLGPIQVVAVFFLLRWLTWIAVKATGYDFSTCLENNFYNQNTISYQPWVLETMLETMLRYHIRNRIITTNYWIRIISCHVNQIYHAWMTSIVPQLWRISSGAMRSVARRDVTATLVEIAIWRFGNRLHHLQISRLLPSGKFTQLWKSLFLVGKQAINGNFQ